MIYGLSPLETLRSRQAQPTIIKKKRVLPALVEGTLAFVYVRNSLIPSAAAAEQQHIVQQGGERLHGTGHVSQRGGV